MITKLDENTPKIDKTQQINKPNSCVLLLTLSCNLKCKVCQLWCNKEDRTHFPSLDKWKAFLDSIEYFINKPFTPLENAAQGEKNTIKNNANSNDTAILIKSVKERPLTGFTVIFGGGEPLLFKDELLVLIAYAHNKGFRTSLATSGYHMTEEAVKELCAAGLDYIAFSVYSLNGRKQDFLRGVPSSLKKVKEAIALFSQHGSHVEIAIDTVLMEPNRKDIVRLTKWVLKHKNISRIMFQAVMQPFHTKPLGDWYSDKEYSFLWPRNVKKMIKIIDNLKKLKRNETKNGQGKVTNSIAQFEIFKQYFETPNRFIKNKHCPTSGNGHFGIAPDGAITLCPYMKGIGNVKEYSLEHLWYSQTACERREEIYSCSRNCHHIVNCWYEEEMFTSM
ncbi:MAG: radical SAM protein [Candidatus Omnitrophica bacterium]|nr:radical SAM protein [Candidatus Omnitrophota bacterium]